MNPQIARTGVGVAAAALISGVAAWWALQLWKVPDWSIPLAYHTGGDAQFNVLLAKNILDTGWYQTNPFLGAPTGLALYDWPAALLVPMSIFKLMTLVFDEPGKIVNIYYLLTWPATGACAAWVLTRFGVSTVVSTACGVLYAALPAHAMRGEAHLFLATLVVVPPALLIAWWTASGRLDRWRERRTRWIGCLLFSATLGASEAYYGFFMAFLVIVAGVLGAFKDRRWRRVAIASVLAFAILLGLLTAIAPSLMHGEKGAFKRGGGDAEIFGLKVAQLFLPVHGHRVPALAAMSRHYRETAPSLLVNENITSPLGALGSIGLVLLLMAAFGINVPARHPEVTVFASRLGMAAILLGTVGGLGALFAIFVSSQVRAYNRISVFIAFLALLVLALALDRLLDAFPRPSRWLAPVIAAVLVVAGTYDQSSLAVVPVYDANLRVWNRDRAWVAQIESAMPPGTLVFQLPYVGFPESVIVHRLFKYDPLLPSFHSQSLRWSFGAMKNHETALWQWKVTTFGERELITAIRDRGFTGLSIDRFGYADGGDGIVTAFGEALGGRAPIEGWGRRYVFFDVRDRASASESESTPPQAVGNDQSL